MAEGQQTYGKAPRAPGSTSQTPLLQSPATPSYSPDEVLLASMRRDGSSHGGNGMKRGASRARLPRIPTLTTNMAGGRSSTNDEEDGFFDVREYETHKPEGILATFALAYGSIGVVFGDLGTSCLYTVAGIFAQFPSNPGPSQDDIIGAISLIFWTITLIAVVKYVFIVLFADDNGEGGTFALYSLLCRHARVSLLGNPATAKESGLRRNNSVRTLSRNILERSKPLRKTLLLVVLLATSMVLGDGVLTPAISVLSAVQGVQVAGPKLSTNEVLTITCMILAALFLFQRFGTARVGFIFAPVTILWLIACASIGVSNIYHYGFGFGWHGLGIFQAVSPVYGVKLIFNNGSLGFTCLCGVILCVTGTEALFADIGHYSRAAIQLAFAGFIYPCLLVTYFGQGAYLCSHPGDVSDTFWKSTPHQFFWPVLVLATMASVVASQALISGAFSLVKQSMSLSCFPRVKVIHTSDSVVGQIYIPEVNYILMALTIAVVLGFQDATKLGNAYGLAVASVMILTTSLMSLVMLIVWNKGIFLTLLFLITFGTIEGAFLAACLPEIPQGAWFPLALAVVFLVVMYAWQFGANKRESYDITHKVRLAQIMEFIERYEVARVPGIALHYSDTVSGVPPALAHSLTTLRSFHKVLVFLTVKHVPVPSVVKEERFEIKRTAMPGAYRCLVYYGYMEDIDHGTEFIDELVQKIVEHVKDDGYPVLKQPRKAGEPPTPEMVEAAKVLEAEVEYIRQNRRDGLVYVMGRADLNPAEGASWFRRLMLEWYRLLKAFSFSPDRMCQIPHNRLLEVGMVYDV